MTNIDGYEIFRLDLQTTNGIVRKLLQQLHLSEKGTKMMNCVPVIEKPIAGRPLGKMFALRAPDRERSMRSALRISKTVGALRAPDEKFFTNKMKLVFIWSCSTTFYLSLIHI